MIRVFGQRVRWLAVVVLLVVQQVPPAAHAQDLDSARAAVQQWIKEELGKPSLILVEYTFAGASWDDSSLGCPKSGETYTPGTVHGYAWTFLFDNLVRYEVHSGLTGSPAVLCGSTNVAPDVPLTTYRSPAFSILVPESWLVYEDKATDATLFAPQADDVCSDPGMRVAVLGRVANGVTPDQLIDQQLAALEIQDAPTERTGAGSFGRSTEYTVTCNDVERRMRLTMFVQYGSAYRVELWSPLDQFNSWDELYGQMLSQFSPNEPIVAAPTATPPASAPTADPNASGTAEAGPDGAAVSTDDTTPDAVAAAPEVGTLPELAPLPLVHLFVGDVFLGTLNELPGRSVTTQPTVERRFLTVSPDGLYFSYINADAGQLRAMNTVDGLSARTIAEDASVLFPPAWSPDSQQIAYVADTGTMGEDGAAIMAIHAVPRNGGEAQVVGMFPFEETCDAELSDPADGPYQAEIGVQARVLVWLPEDRFLFSTGCERGLSVLLMTEQQIVELAADLQGGVLSPDGKCFVSRAADGIVLLDFDAWERHNLRLGPDATVFAWAPDGQSIYYARQTLADTQTLDDPDVVQRGTGIFGMWPATINVYQIELVRLDRVTNAETVLWQGQGRGIGRIEPAPDGSGILFSLVPSGVLLAEVFQSGGDALAIHEATPQPGLYWLPAGSPSAFLVAFSAQPAFAPVTVSAQP